jgi:hypothetical protein
MTSDTGTAKSEPAPKAASTPSKETSKPEGGAPSNYSRGENQKAVTDTYKENWNRIYAKKKTKKAKSKTMSKTKSKTKKKAKKKTTRSR